MKKKTAKQKTNVNGKRGKAQNKHKTLAKELIELQIDKYITNSYPEPIKTDLEKQYYDVLFNSCQSMQILFTEANKYQVAELALLMIATKQLLNDSKNNMIIEEQNGNTLQIVKKINPNMILFLQLSKRIDSKYRDLGLTPQIRADILQKVSTLMSDDVIDDKTAQSNNQGPKLSDFIGLHKVRVKS